VISTFRNLWNPHHLDYFGIYERLNHARIRKGNAMDTKRKMAFAGASMVAMGIGLSLVGAALMVPAIAEWTINAMQKGTERLMPGLERASRTVGTVAGTLQRSFGEATRAGVAELKRAKG
jgi:hypothetical protein